MNYKNFASDYDNLIYDVDYEKIVDFINRSISKNKIIGNNLLEVGSGTGNITSLLNGYNIVAIEKSYEMVLVAQEKLGYKRNIRFVNTDIVNLEIARKFNVVVSVLDVFNYITNIEDIKKTFENIYNHMQPNSIFIFDINSEYKIKDYIGNNTFSDETDDRLYIWQGNYNQKTEINDYSIIFFRNIEENIYERYDELHSQRAYSVDFIKNLLLDIGFRSIKTFDDYTDKDINDKTMRITFTCIKE